MGRMTPLLVSAAVLTLLAPAPPQAQQLRFFYPAPAESSYRVMRDVQYGTSPTGPLRMDVYRPSAGTRHTTLIFFNIASGADRSNPFYSSWARIAASRGVTAILPDLRPDSFAQDFAALQHYLTKGDVGETGIDTGAVSVYAGSGNVSRALPIVQDKSSTAIKSGVMYYGSGQVTDFRADLPMLFVRAGLDRPTLNVAIDRIVATALSQNAPVSVLNYAGGYHSFETRNDEEQTRRVIEQTLEFVKMSTSAEYQASIRRGLLEATAAGHVTSGKPAEAAKAYAQLVAASPDSHTLRLAYLEALLANSEFKAACDEAEKLKGKPVGARDLGLPSARACLQKGDPDLAIAWLKSIPTQFLPRSVQTEAVFTPLKDREDFKALFPAR